MDCTMSLVRGCTVWIIVDAFESLSPVAVAVAQRSEIPGLGHCSS